MGITKCQDLYFIVCVYTDIHNKRLISLCLFSQIMKFKCAQLKEYQIVGKPLSKTNEKTPIYKMKIFAPDEVVAKSRFWYFLRQLKKVRKVNGEVLRLTEVCIYLLFTI